MGNFIDGGNDNNCEQCPIGSYSNNADSTGCTDCPTGTTTSGPGATSDAGCGKENLAENFKSLEFAPGILYYIV